jgi:hypothetical protein
MYLNNSLSAEPFTTFEDDKEKQIEKRKNKTFNIVIIFLIAFAAILFILAAIFGGLYGSALAITIASKKNFSESCLTAQCNDALLLSCINEICVCNGNTYWNGYSCASYP